MSCYINTPVAGPLLIWTAVLLNTLSETWQHRWEFRNSGISKNSPTSLKELCLPLRRLKPNLEQGIASLGEF